MPRRLKRRGWIGARTLTLCRQLGVNGLPTQRIADWHDHVSSLHREQALRINVRMGIADAYPGLTPFPMAAFRERLT